MKIARPYSDTDSVYHYCKLSSAIEHILPNRQLLLNNVGKTNDPRENSNFIFALSGVEGIKTSEILADRITKELRQDCKMICFSMDSSPYFGYELSRMWALYGDNHKGVCVKINREKFVIENRNKVEDTLFKKVNYFHLDVNKPIIHKQIDLAVLRRVGKRAYLRDHFRPEHMDYLFFTKNKEWESEQEFRLVYLSDNKEPEYCTLRTCIDSVILGVDFNSNYLPAVRACCPEIDIYKLRYKEVRLIAHFCQ
jgi:hypothetical protein